MSLRIAKDSHAEAQRTQSENHEGTKDMKREKFRLDLRDGQDKSVIQ